KAKPGTMNYASAGVGTATQLSAERFRLAAGIEAVHVPFRGTPEALTEIITGRVDYYFCPVDAVLPMITETKVLALAMGSSKRSDEFDTYIRNEITSNAALVKAAGIPIQ